MRGNVRLLFAMGLLGLSVVGFGQQSVPVVKHDANAGPIRVAVYDDKGSPRTPADFQRVFGGDTAHFALTFVTAEQIRSGVL